MTSDIETLLREKFPEAFSEPVPLKVGVFADVVAEIPGINKTALSIFLYHWTRRKPYLIRSQMLGSPRIDLWGRPCGAIQTWEVEYAKQLQGWN